MEEFAINWVNDLAPPDMVPILHDIIQQMGAIPFVRALSFFFLVEILLTLGL